MGGIRGGNAAIYKDGEYYGQINPGEPGYDDDFSESGMLPSEWVDYNNAARAFSNEDDASSNERLVAFSSMSGTIKGMPGALPIPIPQIDLNALLRSLRLRESGRVWVTYMLRDLDGGSIVYVGRAGGFGTPEEVMKARFRTHHMRLFGYGDPALDKYDFGPEGRSAIRGREQQLYDRSYPFVANAIRPVARGNSQGLRYWIDSNNAFGPLAPYTGY